MKVSDEISEYLTDLRKAGHICEVIVDTIGENQSIHMLIAALIVNATARAGTPLPDVLVDLGELVISLNEIVDSGESQSAALDQRAYAAERTQIRSAMLAAIGTKHGSAAQRMIKGRRRPKI